MSARVPIRGLAFALSGACLALPSGALAGNGGVSAPSPVDPSFALTARHGVFLGGVLRVKGSDRAAAGRTIAIEARRGAGPWVEVAAVAADRSGSFSATWHPPRAGEFQIRAVAASGARASSASASSAPRIVVVYRAATATWYGPGFYGRRTACGRRLSSRTVGVAHRSLRCGTRVEIAYRGHRLVAPVVDRGPYARGVQWDLTAAAAKRLGMTTTSRIGAAPLDLVQPPVL